MSGSRSLPSFFAVAPMLSTRLTPAGNKTGRSQTVHLCNESSICRFIWGRQTGHIGCLAIWKWKVLLCPYGKPEKTRASNQQLKRPSRTVLTPWFCSPAGQISAGAPRLAPVNGVPTRRPREAFTATISMPRAGRPEAVSAQPRHCQSGKATRPQSPFNFSKAKIKTVITLTSRN